ncbi:MAG TPA: hypothetical protein VJ914_04485 [Pseudonocardiaceae bacterium]|nr:hypothetical protein [Pseudonocardiaceae bacterium]
MITLYFLRTWGKVLLGFLLAVVVEYFFTRHAIGWFFLLLIPTGGAFVAFTVLMWGDWKAACRDGIGYRYDIVRDVTRTRGRG